MFHFKMLFSGFAHRVRFLRINVKEKFWTAVCSAKGVVPGMSGLVVPSLVSSAAVS